MSNQDHATKGNPIEIKGSTLVLLSCAIFILGILVGVVFTFMLRPSYLSENISPKALVPTETTSNLTTSTELSTKPAAEILTSTPPPPTPIEEEVGLPLPPACYPEHVVLISIDALRADAVTTHQALPIMFELGQDGAYDWQADTIKPSITGPGHASMFTGLSPEHHGILTNLPDDLPNGVIEASTVFNFLKEADPKSINIFLAGKNRMSMFNQPGAIDKYELIIKSKKVAEEAVKVILNQEFKMLFVHMPDPDTFGHKYTWESQEYLNRVAAHEEYLVNIIQALKDRGIYRKSLVIITSDHGGHGYGHGNYEDADRWIPFLMVGPCVKNGIDIHSSLRQVSIMDITPTILYSMGIPVPEGLDGSALVEAFSKK